MYLASMVGFGPAAEPGDTLAGEAAGEEREAEGVTPDLPCPPWGVGGLPGVVCRVNGRACSIKKTHHWVRPAPGRVAPNGGPLVPVQRRPW